MSRAEIIAEAKRRGFTHVLTHGGLVALDDWRPYGADGGVNDTPKFPCRWHGEFIEVDTVRDLPEPEPWPVPGRLGLILGVWTLTTEIAA